MCAPSRPVEARPGELLKTNAKSIYRGVNNREKQTEQLLSDKEMYSSSVHVLQSSPQTLPGAVSILSSASLAIRAYCLSISRRPMSTPSQGGC